MKSLIRLTVLAAAALTVSGSWAAKKTDANPVAKVGDVTLTESEMKEAIAMPVFQAEQRVYQIKSGWIQTRAKDILFDRAAKEAKLDRKAWEAREIDKKTEAPSDYQIDQNLQRYIQWHKQQNNGKDPSEAEWKQLRERAKQELMGQQRAQQENKVYSALSDKYGVKILIDQPEAPEVTISITGKDPVKGPDKAPVTIVEFSDFQCPWCARAQDTVKQVEEAYKGKVRVVAKQFPLESIHPEAFKASEAALCAKEQDKYWELREILFANQQKLGATDLLAHAKSVGLKEAAFKKCLDSGKYADKVRSDMAEGQKAGVQGTPSFYVNNVPVPFPQLMEQVKAELSKK